LNYDDVKPLGAAEEVEVSGAERTSFYPLVEAMAKEFRLAIRPDARPEAGHFYRSDHFSLARVGIPSFSINEGMKFKGHPESWGLDHEKEYVEKHYHQPSDEYHSDMDFVGDSAMARFGFASKGLLLNFSEKCSPRKSSCRSILFDSRPLSDPVT
jgi:Zn-dependent M28 family amino/carboxypeptidase